MKAKEYLEEFERIVQSLGDRDATSWLIQEFTNEVFTLAEVRRAHSNEAILSVLRELNQKWNAICRLDKQKRFKPNGFIKFFRERARKIMPEALEVLDKMEELK